MLRIVLLAGLALATLPGAVRAAESYDNCAGTISSLPVTISTPGVWCMKGDLSTSMSAGVAISVNTNNVTIDCNNFRLGGLPAGVGTSTVGILSSDRLNTTVRNCNVRGFLYGVYADGDGHVIEDSRFDANTRAGVYVDADRFIVRRNVITKTGLGTLFSDTFGILAMGSSGLIEHNSVHGVAGAQSFAWPSAAGIAAVASYTVVRQNDVSGIYSGDTSTANGIYSGGARNKLLGNTVAALSTTPTGQRRGVSCTGDATGVAVGNIVSDADSGMAVLNCVDGGGNVVH
jgi:hypothetical protein